MKIFAPLPDVSVHVVEAPLIGRVFAYRRGFSYVSGKVNFIFCNFVTKGKECGSPRPAGVFPLRFGWQSILPTPRQSAFRVFPFSQGAAEFHRLRPIHLFNGKPVTLPLTWIAGHDLFPLSLGDLVLA